MQKTSGLSLLAAALFAPAAAMAGDNPVTAIMTVRSTTGNMTSLTAPGLENLEQCLALAWIASQGAKDWKYKEANVTCLQNGHIIGAQACSGGACTSVNTPVMKPEIQP
jgi:hypothetical protein